MFIAILYLYLLGLGWTCHYLTDTSILTGVSKYFPTDVSPYLDCRLASSNVFSIFQEVFFNCCLYGSIHSSYQHLTHEMVIMYLLPTLFVHSCRTFV
jgi:hypothetical protein